jgi:cyclohexyl-isocyanide hydratase
VTDDSVEFGLLVFQNVQQLDLTGPYEVFASWPRARKPVHARVVRDGNLVTGGGVTAGIDFALTLIAELAGREVAEAIELNLEYAPAPPFNAGNPETAPAKAVQIVGKRLEPVIEERRLLAEKAARKLRFDL